MKPVQLFLLIYFTLFLTTGNAQEKYLKQSWIKSSIEEFRKTPEEPDTIYLRYEFNKSNVLFGFDPGWHSMQMPYLLKGKVLTIGYDTWTVETLTDSTLTIFIPGFRRINFFSETYLQSLAKHPMQIGEFEGKPLFKADKTITARYKKPNPLSVDILKQNRSDDYNIHKAGVFLLSFIVTAEGTIEDPKILKSVAKGYDEGAVRELRKTSKQWDPAVLNGKPIHTLMILKIEFLESLNRY